MTAPAGYNYDLWLGERTGVVLDAENDEAEHAKALYVTTHLEQGGGDGMDLGRP